MNSPLFESTHWSPVCVIRKKALILSIREHALAELSMNGLDIESGLHGQCSLVPNLYICECLHRNMFS